MRRRHRPRSPCSRWAPRTCWPSICTCRSPRRSCATLSPMAQRFVWMPDWLAIGSSYSWPAVDLMPMSSSVCMQHVRAISAICPTSNPFWIRYVGTSIPSCTCPVKRCRRAGQPHIQRRQKPPLRGNLVSARWLFVVNIPRYAGGLRFVPTAVGTDGLLDVCGFRKGSLLHGLRYLGGVVSGQHLRWRDCCHVQTRRIRIESEVEVPYQLDGDPGGVLPLEISVLPARVRLITTESWALHRGFWHGAGCDGCGLTRGGSCATASRFERGALNR